ncbi:T9SS type A sorting domain-containing protein [Pseudopedobacter beijingensis]|uniref:T9SS type A sorting domain-containing protein n=1 Tax=Pseudopedobacter beijingensis TaxID=1207056 RepID=A0ABW4IF45_9SPHI
MKTLLLSFVLFTSLNVLAQTTDYAADGIYSGLPFTSVNVNFTQATVSTDDFPNPIVDNNLRQYDCLGLVRYTFSKRTPPGESKSISVLYNSNPDIDGKNNTRAATIYFPTLKDGVGKIRIEGWLGSGATERNVLLYSYNTSTNTWGDLKYFAIPAGNGIQVVDFVLDKQGPQRLKLEYKSGEYPSITRIAISAYGQELPLPLTLIGYDARLENTSIKNHWTTASEVNTSHFMIERSINGIDFTAVGRVDSKNTAGQHDYYFTDQLSADLLSISTLYYRLKQVDIDDKSNYSKVVPVKVGLGNKIVISPNPAKDYLRVFVPGAKSLSIISVNGVEVFSTKLNPDQDGELVHFGNLVKGLYLVKVTDIENKVIAEKIVIE